jgi:hypothetical protein
MKLRAYLAVGFMTMAVAGYAQQPPTSTAQVQAAAANSGSPDAKMKALEDRVAALEAQVSALTAALTASGGASATAANQAAASTQTSGAQAQPSGTQAAATPQEPATTATPETGGAQPSLGGATGQAKALNPDISAIGDFIGDAGHNPFSGFRSLEMHESEVALQSIVDPYARADFFISFGEEGVDLEEGFITFTALPHSLVAKAGKMRAAFGKVNTLHNHVLPWVDRPLVTYNLVGGEDGIDDAGVSVQRILPAPKWLFLEGTGQVFRGDSEDLFRSAKKNDLSVVGHVRGYHDLTDNTNIDMGVSYSRGHNDADPLGNFVTDLYGVDATLRWKPLQRSVYHSFIGRTELIWNQRQELPFTRRAFGWYGSADYQLGRRWFLGGRYDWADHQRNSHHDSGGSLVLTYWPSEFAQIRGQFRHTFYGPFANIPNAPPSLNLHTINSNELLMQVQFAIGAHGAHPF